MVTEDAMDILLVPDWLLVEFCSLIGFADWSTLTKCAGDWSVGVGCDWLTMSVDDWLATDWSRDPGNGGNGGTRMTGLWLLVLAMGSCTGGAVRACMG